MRKFPIPPPVRQFATRFSEAGFSLYIVGGAVRDHLLGRAVNDYDFATDAQPHEVIKLFKRVIPTGIKHGTVTVLYQGFSHEVTTFRTDGTYGNHRHPDSVRFVSSLEEDLARRDFTINALAVHALDGSLVDYHGGLADVRSKTIRAIGVPSQRFEEDALRILRACRFVSQLEFTIEEETFLAMRGAVSRLKSVSGERIRAELMKIMEARSPSPGLLAMERCGALDILLPELAAGRGVTQKGNHIHDVLAHGIASCEAAPAGKPLVRLAALLHDIGKPAAKQLGDDGEATFHQHELIGERMAKAILDRLKFSNEERAKILNLVRNHMFHYTEAWSDGAVRRFVNKVGIDAIGDLFDLRRADREGIDGATGFEDLVIFADRIASVLAQSDALSLKDLGIDGHDLARLGIPKGPQMGMVLDMLLQTVLDDPSQNEPERLRQIAWNFYRTRMKTPDQRSTSSS